MSSACTAVSQKDPSSGCSRLSKPLSEKPASAMKNWCSSLRKLIAASGVWHKVAASRTRRSYSGSLGTPKMRYRRSRALRDAADGRVEDRGPMKRADDSRLVIGSQLRSFRWPRTPVVSGRNPGVRGGHDARRANTPRLVGSRSEWGAGALEADGRSLRTGCPPGGSGASVQDSIDLGLFWRQVGLTQHLAQVDLDAATKGVHRDVVHAALKGVFARVADALDRAEDH